jgi:hypothetical protein
VAPHHPPAAASQTRSIAPAAAAVAVAADAGRGPTRAVGATVILVDGVLAAHLARGDRQLTTFLPDADPARTRAARAIAAVLIDRARTGGDSPRGMLIEEIDGLPPSEHPLARYLGDAGFVGGAMGFQPTFGHRGSAGLGRQPQRRGATGLDAGTED